MPRYKLTIAYEGTRFCGWQKQYPHMSSEPGGETGYLPGDPPELFPRNEPVGGKGAGEGVAERLELRTVQGVVERAARYVTRQPVNVVGASRTDSGVHAKGQVCAFTTVDRGEAERMQSAAADEVTGGVRTNDERFGSGWPRERGCGALVRALNSRLPEDVLVRSAEIVPDDFDPIGGAASKRYSYTIWNSRQRPMWTRRTMMHIYHDLDASAMHAAAQLLVGEHDFGAFATTGHGRLTTVRRVHSCEVRSEPIAMPTGDPGAMSADDGGEVGGNVVRIEISGSGFLWNMVRIVSGTLVEVGKGKMGVSDVERALAEPTRANAGPTLPPEGLCLEEIRYATGV